MEPKLLGAWQDFTGECWLHCCHACLHVAVLRLCGRVQELKVKGLSMAHIEGGLVATFGHAQRDIATPEFRWALQDLPVLSGRQLQEARAGCADTTLCTVVHLLDACRSRLRGPGDTEKQLKRLEAWLLARQHSRALVRLVTDSLRSELEQQLVEAAEH